MSLRRSIKRIYKNNSMNSKRTDLKKKPLEDIETNK
jgi:hypothetical protein